MQVTAPAGDDSDRFVSWTFGATAKPSSVRVQFQMRIVAVPSGSSSDARVIAIDCNNGAQVRLRVKPSSKLQLEGTITTSSTAPAAQDTWGMVKIDWNGAATTATVQSELIPGETLLASATPCEAPFTVSLGFGNWSSAPHGAYTLMFDDFQVAEE